MAMSSSFAGEAVKLPALAASGKVPKGSARGRAFAPLCGSDDAA